MSISSRRELWDSHRKFRRKAQDRGVCLLGEWVSLITVPRCCLPTPFLDNKTLPASFHSSLRNSLLCFGRHGAAHSRSWMMQHVWWTTCVPSGCQEYTRLWSLRLPPLPKTSVFVPFLLPPKAIPSSLLGRFAYSFKSQSWSASIRWLGVVLKAT